MKYVDLYLIAHVKGISTRMKLPCRNPIVLEQSIAILQTLYVDVMFGEELPFLIGVSKPMNLISIEKLKNRTAKFIELVMYNFADTYRSNSFEVERSELFATMNQLWRVH